VSRGVPVVPGNASTFFAAARAPTVVAMDNRAQVREFLITRRERISPTQARSPAYGGNRRVKGLRREEVALLAGVDFFADWERSADDIAAMLRSEAGRNPHDKQLIELIGELSTRSEDFRARWAAHIVRFHRTGHKRFHHLVVGTLDLDFEAMEFPAHPGLTLLVYTAAAATPAADNLKLLASWAATAEQTGDLPTYA
jgi:MmyB-like transcription regulator ligand binding domain